MKYTIFIDETGNFYKKSTSGSITDIIGGCVFLDNNKEDLEQLLINSEEISNINNEILNKYKNENCFNIKKDMHFSPLHNIQFRTGNDAHIKVPEGFVEKICQIIFDTSEPKIEFIFRSSGFPKYFANEQSSYIEILKSTIIQLLKEKIFIYDDCEEINIIIASRRVEALIGKTAKSNFYNTRDYERNLCANLKNDVLDIHKEILKNKILNIKIEQSSNIKIVGLGLELADFFCGALKDKKSNSYLDKYENNSKIREYNIHDSLLYVPTNDILSILKYINQDDPTGAIITAIEFLSSKYDNKVDKLLNIFLEEIQLEKIILLNEELKIYFNEELSSSNRYMNIDFIRNFINILNKKLVLIENKDTLQGDIIKATILKNQLKVYSHSGSIFDFNSKNNLFDEYKKMIEEKGSEIYGSIYKALQERHEALLTYSTILFNSFEFESLIPRFENEITQYKKMLFNETQADNNIAKLEGTLGQIFALKACYANNENKEQDFLKAEKHFLADKKYLTKKIGKDINQVNGYLTTLYFRQGNLDKSIESFIQETNFKGDFNQIYDFSNQIESDRNVFMLLHRLYICSLAQKVNNQKIKNIEVMEKYFLNSIKEENLKDYPYFLVIKWLSNLYYKNEEKEKSYNVLQKVQFGSIKENNFTVELIKLPIILITYYLEEKYEFAKKTITKNDIENDISDFVKKLPSIQNFLKSEIKLYEKYLNKNVNDWDIFEVCNIMPFYYS